MRRLVRYLSKVCYRFIAMAGIRAPIRLYMRLSNRNFVPAVMDVPVARNVLVLAPHMDDETIGCGGAILSHVSKGSHVEVLFVTDGAKGFLKSLHPDKTPEQRRSIRRAEGDMACRLLGVSKCHYLDLPDGSSQPTAAAVKKLRALMDELQPEVVYLPFFTDTHHDHRTTNQIFSESIRQKQSNSHMLCCSYEVWTPIFPNCIVDISAHMDEKMAALECYQSQLQMNNYLKSVRGLNAYRSIANQSKGYAEAFYLTTAKDYLSLLDGT